jgi:hypothetical protein
MDELKAYAGYLIGLAGAIVAWLARRDVARYDEGLDRISELEQNSVTYDELDRIMSRLSAERAAMHQENTQWLRRIEDKLDENADQVHDVALKVAAIAR